MVNQQGAYVDIERYNNYLFDKAATTLVAQAKEKGIELDKKDVLAQLKENNAEIAALKFDFQGRLEKLAYNSTYRRLTYSDIQGITDIYIMAKENGEDLSDGVRANNVTLLVSKLTHYRFAQTVTMGYGRSSDIPDATLKLAAEIRGKMTDSFGFGIDFFNNILDPNKALALCPTQESDVVEYEFLQFLSQMVDIKQGKTPTKYDGLPPDYVPCDKPRDVFEFNRYAEFARSQLLSGKDMLSYSEYKALGQSSGLSGFRQAGATAESSRSLVDFIRSRLEEMLGKDFMKYMPDPKTGAASNVEDRDRVFLELVSKLLDLKDMGRYFSVAQLVKTLGGEQ